MEDIILEDDCKKECKKILVALIIVAICTVMVFVNVIMFASKYGWFVFAIMILVCCVIFLEYIYYVTYKIRVTRNEIIFKELSRTIQIDLNKPFEYTYKKGRKKSPIYSFDFIVNNKKLLLFTRYYLELNEILQSKLREQAEKAAQTEEITQTDSNKNLH